MTDQLNDKPHSLPVAIPPSTSMPEGHVVTTAQAYHPDREIDAEVMAEANENEIRDVVIGYEPRWWQCAQCGAAHNRGFFQVIGVHRCLGCGYVGTLGYYHDSNPNAVGALAAGKLRKKLGE